MSFQNVRGEARLGASQRQAHGIVLLDHNCAARRRSVIAEALSEGAERSLHAVNLEVLYSYRRSDVHGVIENFSRCRVFVVIGEEQLATLSDKSRLPRIPCASIACGYELLDQFRTGVDVYFVTGGAVCGFDVASMLLSGATGVIDSETLGATALIELILDDKRDPSYRILAGRPQRVLESAIQLIRGKHRMAERHFSLLMALAEIPAVRLDISAPVTQKEVVNQIQSYVTTTGFNVKLDTYRLLPTLLTILKGEMATDEKDQDGDDGEDDSRLMLNRNEKPELAYLPLYARMMGLPACVLPIRGVPQENLIREIYRRGIYGLERVDQTVQGVQIGLYTLPNAAKQSSKKREKLT